MINRPEKEWKAFCLPFLLYTNIVWFYLFGLKKQQISFFKQIVWGWFTTVEGFQQDTWQKATNFMSDLWLFSLIVPLFSFKKNLVAQAPKTGGPTINTQPAIMKPTEEPPAYTQQQAQVRLNQSSLVPF